MSTTGLDVFDRTLQSTHIWLNEIGQQIGPDKQRCYHALRGVMFALRDRLSVEEAFHLSAELPMLVRGILWERYRPTGKPEKSRWRDDFLENLSNELGHVAPMNALDASKAVFDVMERHIPQGELDDIKHMLPEHVRNLFPTPPSA